MKKRIFALLLAALLCASLFACDRNGNDPVDTDNGTDSGTVDPAVTAPATSTPDTDDGTEPVTEPPETSPVVIPDTPASELSQGWKLFRFEDYTCDVPDVEGVVTGYHAEFDIDYPAVDDYLPEEILKNTVRVPVLQFGGESNALNQQIREDIAGAYGDILTDLVSHAIGERQMVFNLSYDYAYAGEASTMLQLRVTGTTSYRGAEIRENVYMYYFNTDTGRIVSLEDFLLKMAGQQLHTLSRPPEHVGKAEEPLASFDTLLSVLQGKEALTMPLSTAVIEAQYAELPPSLTMPNDMAAETLGGVYFRGNTVEIYLNRYWGDSHSPYHIGTDYVVLPDAILPVLDVLEEDGLQVGYYTVCLRQQKGQSILTCIPSPVMGLSSSYFDSLEVTHVPLSGSVKVTDGKPETAIFQSYGFESTAFGEAMTVSSALYLALLEGEDGDILAAVNAPSNAPNRMEKYTGIYGIYLSPSREVALVDAADILREAKKFFGSDYDFIAASRTEAALHPDYRAPKLTLIGLTVNGTDICASFALTAATETHEANLTGSFRFDMTTLQLDPFFAGGCSYGERASTKKVFADDVYFMEVAPAGTYSEAYETVMHLSPDGKATIHLNMYEGFVTVDATYSIEDQNIVLYDAKGYQILKLIAVEGTYSQFYTIEGYMGTLQTGGQVKWVLGMQFEANLMAQQIYRTVSLASDDAVDGKLQVTVTLSDGAPEPLQIPEGYFIEVMEEDGSYSEVDPGENRPTFRGVSSTLQPGKQLTLDFDISPYWPYLSEDGFYRICIPAIYGDATCVLHCDFYLG